jgi:hypothetical protein
MHKYIVPASFSLLRRPQQSIRLTRLSSSFSIAKMARTSLIKAAAAAARANQPKTRREPAKPGNAWISEDKLAELYPFVTDDGRVSLPGFGPPVNYMVERDQTPDYSSEDVRWTINRCPNALQEWAPEPLTVRERTMMQLINALTDKPDWRRKVFDETILAKWRAEAVTAEGQGFTEKMFDYVSLHVTSFCGLRLADIGSVLQSFKIKPVNTKRTTWSLYLTQSGLW